MVMDGNFVSIFHSLPLEASFWIPRRRRLYCHDSISQNKKARVEVSHAQKPASCSPALARGSPSDFLLLFSFFFFPFSIHSGKYICMGTSRGRNEHAKKDGSGLWPPVFLYILAHSFFVLWRWTVVFMI
ncbi:uncharacterized protein B0H64DRAFT_32023 [Chaetomium fimeti]|jgi:hypothetical protein|uniref:Transmembrane protein n=1 Tax=Chaetomium fimeti TaxID=1854472 RepID=A0AAE0LXF7_9PEZI|nr:hypothetical protein B0H64DRAFT_32023 [Chaetomium fimeti]